jgi:hypothetical protein
LLGALAAVLTLLAGAGLWRLMQGPIDLDILAPYIQEALDQSVGGLPIAISGVRAGVNRETRRLDLWIAGVRISQTDGEPLVTLPAISADFNFGSLLHGRLAPTRVVVERPLLRLVRGEAGSVRLHLGDQEGGAPSLGPEIFEQLAGPAKPKERLGLIRRIVVRDATLVLDDRQTGRRWRADRVDVAFERDNEGFTSDLSLALQTGTREAELHVGCRYSSIGRTLDCGAELGAIEPAALASLAPEFAPLALADFPVSGTLATRLNLSDMANEGVRLDLHFGRGSIQSQLLPEGALALQQGTFQAVYAPETRELRLAALDLDLGGGSVLSAKGSLKGVTPAMLAGTHPTPASIPGALEIALTDVPVRKFESLWPPSLSRGGRRWVLENVHDGLLDEASVRLDLDVDAAARAAEVTSARGTMRYHDATITYFRGLAPVRGVGGTATLQDKRLVFTPSRGAVKSVRLTGGSVEINDLGAPVEGLAVNLSFAGPLQDVLETIDAKPLHYARDIRLDPARVTGRIEANMSVKLPLLQDIKLDQVDFGVKAALTGAGIARVAMNRDLTDGNFAVEIARPGAHLKGNSRFDGVPLNLDANLFFRPKDGVKARYGVAMTLNDEQRRRLAFDFLPDRINGPVGLDLTYWVTDGSRAEAEAALDLRSTSLSIPEAGWGKPTGAPATARVVLDLYNERITRLPEIDVKATGLDGRFAVTLASDAEHIDRVDIRRLIVGDNDVTGFVGRRRGGGWRVDLRGPRLDVSHWIKDFTKGDRRRDAVSNTPLQIDARVGRLVLGPRREVHDLNAQLLREGVDWQVAQIDARFENGRQLSLHSGNEVGPRSLTFRTDDLGSALRLFDITDNVVGGRVTVTGKVQDTGGKRVVDGQIAGEDYSLIHAPVFARILSLPSFSGLGSMLSGSGIPFSTLSSKFAYSEDHLVLENLQAYGGAIGVTANGTVDVGQDRLDLQGTIVPAFALNSIIGNIPVIGSLLLGGEGQGLFAANYRVTGSAADPDVSVNPLSALAPGFLRRLFQQNFGVPPPVQQSLGIQ